MIKPLLETAWLWLGVPTALLLTIILCICSAWVSQDGGGDSTQLINLVVISLLSLLGLVVLLVAYPDGAIADRDGLTLWSVWRSLERRQIAWSKIYALDIQKTYEHGSYVTRAYVEVQEGEKRLVVPCLYSVQLFRAIVSHAQLVAREMPASWQARTRRGDDPWKVLHKMSRTVGTGKLRWYWAREDLASGRDSSAAEALPFILIEPESVDFGTLSSKTDQSVQVSVTVLNPSQADARCCIVGAPWWLRARPKIFSLAPGALQAIELEVDVGQVRGRKQRIMLTFALDEGAHQEVEVRLEVSKS